MGFWHRFKEYSSRKFDEVIVAVGLFSVLRVPVSVYLFWAGRIGAGRLAMCVVESLIFGFIGWKRWEEIRAYDKVRSFSSPQGFSQEQRDLMFASAFMNLNEELWLKERTVDPNWRPLNERVRFLVDMSSTNAGMSDLESVIKELSPTERLGLIMHLQQMWMAMELRCQLLGDAKAARVCDGKYADDEIYRAEKNRDVLVGIEIFARSTQIYEDFKGSVAYLLHGAKAPTLRYSMWKAATFSGGCLP